MELEHIVKALNPEQHQAVTSDSQNLLVLAGAGSGKTRVLVHRIAWLIKSGGYSPHSVLAVTFTNKAAKEMRHRIEELLAMPARGMWVGTFHGLAHRLLKAHWQEAGLQQNFQILDSDDQLRIVKRICKNLDLDDSRWPPKQAQWFINEQKDEGRRAAHVNPSGDVFHETMLKVYREYEEACERGGLVDFAELLLRAHELWLKQPSVLQHYQRRFQAILVDEFQDTNTIQYAWLRVLADNTIPITAVGDDDQSIYGWRGAKIENIQQFTEDFKNTETVRLEQNYRSSANILNAANALIANNSGRMGKNLWTEDTDGEAISLYAAFNELDEARYIVERIEQLAQTGQRRSDIAILYRSNAQSRVLEEGLLRQGIPYRVYGGQRFYDRLEIKNALAYMRLLVARGSDAAFERVVNLPTRGIGGKTLDEVRILAREQQLSMWEASTQLIAQQRLTARASNALLVFLNLIDSLDKGTDGLSLAELADHVLTHSGLLDFHGKEKGEKGQARVENLEELVSACRGFEPGDEELSPLQEFLDTAALDSGDTQADEFEDCIQMMTLHSAKGLEFPFVFLAGLEENLFPHRMSMDEPGRLEEERRLCYVGITRAMEKLHISYAESRRLHGSDTYNTQSRFVREIPQELVQEVRMKSAVQRPVNYGYSGGYSGGYDSGGNKTGASSKNKSKTSLSEHTAVTDQSGQGFALGQRVQHKVFGEGVVLNFNGNGNNTRIEVNFDAKGRKELVLALAKLEAL
ncbi:MAG: DNA helicase II [Pseudomonadales bacterium]